MTKNLHFCNLKKTRYRPTDRLTDGRTDPLIELRGVKKKLIRSEIRLSYSVTKSGYYESYYIKLLKIMLSNQAIKKLSYQIRLSKN